jgi:hypothetical protein
MKVWKKRPHLASPCPPPAPTPSHSPFFFFPLRLPCQFRAKVMGSGTFLHSLLLFLLRVFFLLRLPRQFRARVMGSGTFLYSMLNLFPAQTLPAHLSHKQSHCERRFLTNFSQTAPADFTETILKHRLTISQILQLTQSLQHRFHNSYIFHNSHRLACTTTP